MSRSVELSDEDYARLEEAAAAEGVTPVEWVARHLPACPDVQPCPDGAPPQTLADLFAGHIGRFSSGDGKPRIEELRESFGEYLEAKHRGEQAGSADTGVEKPVTMAERLAGRIGTLSGTAVSRAPTTWRSRSRSIWKQSSVKGGCDAL